MEPERLGTEVDDLIDILQEDVRVAQELRRKNEELRTTNEKLRKVITELAEELREVKQDTAGDFEYSYGKGWKEAAELEIEEIEEMDPDETEQQLIKISKILTGEDND